jgi:hypothetical protein
VWYDKKITLKKSDFESKYVFRKISICEKNKFTGADKNLSPSYVQELNDIINKDRLYLNAVGDLKLCKRVIKNQTSSSSTDLPILVKAAWASRSKRVGIIVKLDCCRHWQFTRKGVCISDIKKYDKSWSSKNDAVIWRGVASTLHPSCINAPLSAAGPSNSKWGQAGTCRLGFIENYYKDYDIGFSSLLWEAHPSWEKLLKKRVSHEDQLKNKYIISLEGNDVASGLKWQLMSNSMVIMPKPIKISWAMEDTLVPYEHYVPLADSLDNLEEVLQWCRENDSTCKEIAENATQYIQQFLDLDREDIITKEIIDRYDKNVSWE